METIIEYRPFSRINLSDIFFDSLKTDYKEFENWFNKKAQDGSSAFILEQENSIQAFLYLKIEYEEITDVIPPLPAFPRVKVGTFKVNPHGTRLGERFIKKIFDFALVDSITQIYVTVFSQHEGLIQLLTKYGFRQHGIKRTSNGKELVLLKDFDQVTNSQLENYPKFQLNGNNKYLLAVYPAYHTRLFPDSILNNETFREIDDVSHTNSIHKIYLSGSNLGTLLPGDAIIIYRTSDNLGPAHYRSVATSICIVEQVRNRNSFNSFADYLAYCQPYSVFDKNELLDWYNKRSSFVIKMTYNAAFQRRLTRKLLIENIGLNPLARWNYLTLSDDQFSDILLNGTINENLIINQA